MKKEVLVLGIVGIALVFVGAFYFSLSDIQFSPKNFFRQDRTASVGLEESKTGVISQARQEACAESASLLKELDEKRTLDGGTPSDLRKAVEECLQEKRPEGELKTYLNEVSSQRGGSCVPAIHDIVPNGEVDVFDLIELLNNWGATGQNIADVNGDEVVDTFDLLQLLNMWNGILCECGNNVIEPGEQCDDGNTNNGDGCSSQCLLEGGLQFIEICTAEDLDNVRNNLFGIYKQTCDIDLQGYAFEPIGDLSEPFMGIYDGQGYKISNFNFVDQERNRVGLFGMAGTSPNKGALIRNVHLENANVEGKANVGSLAGMTFGSTIENSSVRDSVVIGQELLNPGHAPFVIEPYTGGLVGHLHPGSVCRNCESFDTEVRGKSVVGGLIGNVHGSQLLDSRAVNPRVIGNGEMVGGLAGWTQFDQFMGSTNLIQGSHAENVDVVNVNDHGNYTGGAVGLLDPNTHVIGVHVDGGSVASKDITNPAFAAEGPEPSYVGGLIGKTESPSPHVNRIEDSYSTANVFGNNSYVGGLIGLAEGGTEISDSYATGDVSGESWYIGGLIGLAEAEVFGNKINIRNSYAIGYVRGPIGEYGDGFDGIYIGGFAGAAQNGVYINNSYATGNVEYIGGLYGGGFIGRLFRAFTEDGLNLIDNSYATGNVNSKKGLSYLGGFTGGVGEGSYVNNSYATGNVTNPVNTEAGGFVGLHKGTIENSYATGDVYAEHGDSGGFASLCALGGKIIGSYATGNVSSSNTLSANAPVGGFVGEASECLIQNSYSVGKVANGSNSGQESGGFAGEINSLNGITTIVDSYWDIETSEKENGCGIIDCDGQEVFGRTTQEMTSVPRPANTFVEWDFVDIWDQVDGDYPFLRWEA